ncbi:unnamed protein product [Ectocarpus fasciculatus]
MAGSCAGMASILIMYPMDTVRTRLQMAGSQGKALGVRSCVGSTFRNEGVRAFYKGMAFPLAAQVVFKAVIFTTNGIARRALDRRGLADSPAGVYACGALGGGVNSFIVTPVELVRTRLMLQYGRKPASSAASSTSRSSGSAAGGGGGGGDGRLRGPLDCVRQVVRRNGVFGMWQGLRVTLTRDSLGMGAFFLAFDTVKRTLAERRYGSSSGELSRKRPPDFDHLLVAGSTAGLCFWLVALPLDMTKTVIQAAGRKRGEVIPGAVATLSRLFREGGLRNLYMGWPVAFGRGIPGAAIMLATHTFASQKLGDYAAATTARPPAAAAVAAVAKKAPRTNRME